ncbi:MAG: redox-regulated ATPase YchF [Patescibacteria group bacterium]
MPLQIGIVGLPNVGKSTLFQAITKKQVDCANFPFCTIDPNVGVVEVPDQRLAQLAEISHSKKIMPTTIEFVDIAGLVKGASEGQGLGNKFLAHIRECDAIAQVLRVFEDPDVIHVESMIDPVRDAETIGLELALADLETVTKRLGNLERQLKSGKIQELEFSLATTQKAKDALEKGTAIRDLEWTNEERRELKSLALLTFKPMIYVANVSEKQLQDGTTHLPPSLFNGRRSGVPICVKLEAELATMSPNEVKEYLSSLGQERSGLDCLIVEAYTVLGLLTFLTSGEMETRAWTVTQGTKAPAAAGVIHSDFEKNFIRVEVTDWKDFVSYGGEARCREKGLVRIEGKEYVVRDGDVCYFRVGV